MQDRRLQPPPFQTALRMTCNQGGAAGLMD